MGVDVDVDVDVDACCVLRAACAAMGGSIKRTRPPLVCIRWTVGVGVGVGVCWVHMAGRVRVGEGALAVVLVLWLRAHPCRALPRLAQTDVTGSFATSPALPPDMHPVLASNARAEYSRRVGMGLGHALALGQKTTTSLSPFGP